LTQECQQAGAAVGLGVGGEPLQIEAATAVPQTVMLKPRL